MVMLNFLVRKGCSRMDGNCTYHEMHSSISKQKMNKYYNDTQAHRTGF